MTTTYYTDTENVIETIEYLVENTTDREVKVTVLDESRARIVASQVEKLIDRGLYDSWDATIDDSICNITITKHDVETTRDEFGSCQLALSFHENAVTETLEFRPAGAGAICPQQATPPSELSDRLGRALSGFVDRGASFSFKGVSAASVGNTHYTDFEYEYAIDDVSI